MEGNLINKILCETFEKLYQAGLNTTKSGNISARVGKTMIISPSGVAVSDITPEKFVEVRIGDGEIVDGSLIPSSEWQFHHDIYHFFKENKAIIDTHSTYATALSCLGMELPPFHYMIATFGPGSVKCARYETFGTAELSLSVRDAIKGSKVCLLANHGAIAIGESISEAYDNAVLLEELAKIYLISISAGKPTLLLKEEMLELKNKFTTYGKNNDFKAC